MLSSGLSFAVLVLEREPLTAEDLPAKFQSWVQDAGGFAAVGLAIWLIARLVQRSSPKPVRQQRHGLFRVLFLIGCVGAALSYLLLGVLHALNMFRLPAFAPLERTLLTAGGACALFAAGLPFVVDLVKLRGRRIWALAVLSFREAVRRKVYLVFCSLLLVLLFLDWFVSSKPENQLRDYVQVISWTMTVLLMFTAALLAAFSIPTDVRNQTIHTIITKPVERFEIVLGRFLGYVMLLSLTLGFMTLVSLLFVWRGGFHPLAIQESYRARVPLYGDLQLYGSKGKFEGKEGLVGREWEYRRYIAGNSSQRAYWLFRELPTRLGDRQTVPCEFAFDIFRTSKGTLNRGVFCTFTFQSRNWSTDDLPEYEKAREEFRRRTPPMPESDIDNELARKFGYCQIRSVEIADFHTFRIDVPVGLFENAARVPEGAKQSSDKKPPMYAVVVQCESPSQFVGVAKRDLYLLDAEGFFGLNFFKGSAGLWCSLCLVIGLAVTCSTYLSGIISLVCALFLVLLGMFTDFVVSVAAGTNEGGGPAEAFYRLVNNKNMSPLDQTPVVQVAVWSDEGFRWFLRRFLNVVPDMQFYDLTNYVSEGFDISWVNLGLHVLVLFAYLLPWAVLAYYMVKSREIAS